MSESDKRAHRAAVKRAWYQANKERINARNRERYANDPEYRKRILDWCAEYKQRNPEKARAAVRKWHAERQWNAEYKAAWREKNREQVRAYAREDARRRRAAGDDEDYGRILEFDLCSYCGAPSGEVDHIVPVIDGGDGHWSNLTAACRACNAQKHRRSLLTFLLAQAPTTLEDAA